MNILLSKEQKVIIHNDYDGVLTYLLYKAFVDKNATFEGFYNLTYSRQTAALLTKSPLDIVKDKDNVICLDIDCNFFQSFGHHVQIEDLLVNYHEKSVNLNVIDKTKTYGSKCPFSAAIMIMALNPNAKRYLKDLCKKKDYEKIAIIAYADNFLKIFRDYSQNATKWLERYGLRFFDDFLAKNYEELVKCCKNIETEIIKNTKKNAKYNEFMQQFALEEAKDVYDGLVKKMLKIGNSQETFLCYYKLEFLTKEMKVDDCQIVNKELVFSHSRTASDNVKISFIKEN